MQSIRINAFSRLIHTTRRLLQPRVFRGLDNLVRRPSKPTALDRQAIKENVQSLYGTSWETVYEQPQVKDRGLSKHTLGPRADCVSMGAIKAFVSERCSTQPVCLGDEFDGLILLEITSSRIRISIAEDLIRNVRI